MSQSEKDGDRKDDAPVVRPAAGARSQSGHTTAPWTAEPLSLTKEDCWAVHRWEIRHRKADDCWPVALVYSPGFSSDFCEQSEVDANARLIAAAPELLAVCKSVLATFEQGTAVDWLALARVVDKAEGRSARLMVSGSHRASPPACESLKENEV